MKYVVVVHIHGCFAACSSSDNWLYLEFDAKKPAKNFIHNLENQFRNFEYREVNVSKIDDVTAFYCADKTFYNVREFSKHYNGTPEYEALIARYKTFCLVDDEPASLRNHYDNDRKREYEPRTKKKFVFCFPYEEYSRDKIQGGFSDAVFNHNTIVNYTKEHPCGFIGHSVRKSRLDAYMEKAFMKITRPMYIGVPELIDLFTCWLTSSDGRHFGDSLEEFSFVKQKEMIDKYLPNMYNTAFVYNLKEHKGSLASTIDLSAKYKHRLIA